jgi:hypothetical protein
MARQGAVNRELKSARTVVTAFLTRKCRVKWKQMRESQEAEVCA